jgi:hypothetical protein
MNPNNLSQQSDKDELAGDLLVGAEAIAAYMTELGIKTEASDVYYAHRSGKLRGVVGKYGATLISGKRRIGRHFQKKISAE